MRPGTFILAGIALAVAAPLSAQGAGVIDLNAKAKPFPQADYDALLACTVTKFPEQTRRFSEYHVQRRSVQTPEQNETDPASRLGMEPVMGCHELQAGKPLRFDLQRLVADWAKHHRIAAAAATQVTDMPSLARCSAQFNPSMAGAYLQVHAMAQMTGSERDKKSRRMLVEALTIPPCTITGDLEIDHGKLAPMIAREMQSQQARP